MSASGGKARPIGSVDESQKVFLLKNSFPYCHSKVSTDRHPDRKSSGGRPRKFAEPSRPITLTLPETTLRDLRSIDTDRAQAIVKLTKMALRSGGPAPPLVEIVELAPNTGLIIIGPSHILRQVPFLHLVPVAPARYLLALDAGHDFKSLEIAVNDVLDNVPKGENGERELIVQLLGQMRSLRKTERVRMAEIIFVRLANKRRDKAAD